MKYILFALSIFLFPGFSLAHFDDVPTTHPQAAAIDYVQHEGIVQGYADGTYRPDAMINRAEFLKILLEANPDEVIREPCFPATDVVAGAWYADYVCEGYSRGIVSGYGDGTFRPGATINYAEAAKIVVEVYELSFVPGEAWYTGYVQALEVQGATPRVSIQPGDALTRGEMAQIIYGLVNDQWTSMASDHLGSYIIRDPEHGTETTVTVSGTTRTIVTNELPDHATGDFPNSGNPNAISAQNSTYSFPVNPVYTGNATETNVPGVAINGVKMEPGTAETVSCTTGEQYRVEAFQEVLNLGLDFNNAHVQPTGAYHYHGVPEGLVENVEDTGDLVHVGFARDGHLMYYSRSGVYESSYGLKTSQRTGANCDYSVPFGPQGIDLNGTMPDGTFGSDWQYVAGSGDLDECNGIEMHGEYVYVLTQEYPYIPRCLMGEFEEVRGGGGGGAQRGGRPPRR